MRRWLFLSGIVFLAVLFTPSSARACICPGVNPDLYPPDFSQQKKYFSKDFKGEAYTGKVLEVKFVEGQKTDIGDNVIAVSVEIDRVWIGSRSKRKIFYTSDNVCGPVFVAGNSYFFIPSHEKGLLYIAPCTYSTYSNKADGNYVGLMTRILGKGNRPRT